MKNIITLEIKHGEKGLGSLNEDVDYYELSINGDKSKVVKVSDIYDKCKDVFNTKKISTKNKSKVYEVISKEINVPCDEINNNANLKSDYGLDSLDFVNIIMVLEKEFDIILPDDKIEGIETVQEVLDLAEKNINNKTCENEISFIF